MYPDTPVSGVGLGLRRAHLGPLLDRIPDSINFMELAPENWIGAGGRLAAALESIASRVPLVSHGLLGNFGGPDPLDEHFLNKTKTFLSRYNIQLYGDHLTYCADEGQLYELLPMPLTPQAASYMADRIKQIQDHLGQAITVENASYYCTPVQLMPEVDFINQVLDESGCLLLLDVNNVYVNSCNHQYDPREFLKNLPAGRIAYAHIAGHLKVEADLIIDTHGEDIADPVWELLDDAYQLLGVFPTLLERDENIPDLETVLLEVDRIHAIQNRYLSSAVVARV